MVPQVRQTYANQLRRQRPRPGDKWHLDEMFIKINGRVQYLWRAVDQDGNVLDILVQSRRNKKAAKKFFRKLLKGLQFVPRVLITDKLKSYSAAKAETMPGVEHRQHYSGLQSDVSFSLRGLCALLHFCVECFGHMQMQAAIVIEQPRRELTPADQST